MIQDRDHTQKNYSGYGFAQTELHKHIKNKEYQSKCGDSFSISSLVALR